MFSTINPSKCTNTWSSGQPTLVAPGEHWGFGALLKGLTSVVDNSCRSRDSTHNLELQDHPLGHGCPVEWESNLSSNVLLIDMGSGGFQILHSRVIREFTMALLWCSELGSSIPKLCLMDPYFIRQISNS